MKSSLPFLESRREDFRFPNKRPSALVRARPGFDADRTPDVMIWQKRGRPDRSDPIARSPAAVSRSVCSKPFKGALPRPLAFPPGPRTYHHHDRWQPQPQHDFTAWLVTSFVTVKAAPILAMNREFSAALTASGRPSVFPF
jgi:hypothetical protein